ncbi:hypothetical protein KY329_00775 [Candidatus Woesearchaeota archaeon]|nr:hypothetical protein [Candidatus Woesearchaeota archaeon]
MNKYTLFAAVVICLVLLAGNSITGMFGETKALTLNNRAELFFGVDNIILPYGQCMQPIQDLYSGVADTAVYSTSGYSGYGENRFATTTFIIDMDEIYGTMDFVKSPEFLADRDADSYIALSSEAVIRVPKATKRTYLVMDLLGVTRGRTLFLTKGRMSTPTTDCIFWIADDGTKCNCNIHTTMGIALGGVTAAPKVEERMRSLFSELGEESLYGEIW